MRAVEGDNVAQISRWDFEQAQSAQELWEAVHNGDAVAFGWFTVDHDGAMTTSFNAISAGKLPAMIGAAHRLAVRAAQWGDD